MKKITYQTIKNLVYSVIACGALASCGGSSTSSTPTAAPTTAATATLGFDIKTFRFTWSDVSDATFYRLMENVDGSSGFTQVGSDVTQGTQSVDHIVPLYNRVNASYILQSCNVIGCIDSSAVNVTGALVDAIGYFKASDPSNTHADDIFGTSISFSDDGTTLAVGAEGEGSSISGINNTMPNNLTDFSGAVYIFTRSGSGWSQQAYIKSSNPDSVDVFGGAIKLSADGNTLAVGARGEDSSTSGINTTSDNLLTNAGATYVYVRSNNTWSEQAYIKASNPGSNDSFGGSVSLSGDGNLLAVGARHEQSSTLGINTVPDDLANNAGATYVFSRTGSTWFEQSYIKPSNTSINDSFGITISLSDDGNTLVVGAVGEDSDTSGINATGEMGSGAAYIYVFNGSTWSEQAFIKASNAESNDNFGFSVNLSADGNTLAVGANGEDSSTSGINTTPDELLLNSGATYVFSRSGSTWSEQAYIKASNVGRTDDFGASVSLSNDGNTLAVGAYSESSNTLGINTVPNELADASGAAYVYRRNGTTWLETSFIKATNPEADDEFGRALSLSGDGNTLAVGSKIENSSTSGINSTPDNLSNEVGAVYLY